MTPLGSTLVYSLPGLSDDACSPSLPIMVVYVTAVPWSPLPDTVMVWAARVNSGAVVSAIEKAWMTPLSWEKKSCARSFHVPFGLTPVSAENEFAGFQVPVNGASAEPTVWMFVAAVSSYTAWQMLLPLPPTWSINTTLVPSGAMSVNFRSETKVWARPAVGEPAAVEHAVPPMVNTTLLTTPVIPDTSRLASAGAPGLVPLRSAASGIATGAPE